MLGALFFSLLTLSRQLHLSGEREMHFMFLLLDDATPKNILHLLDAIPSDGDSEVGREKVFWRISKSWRNYSQDLGSARVGETLLLLWTSCFIGVECEFTWRASYFTLNYSLENVCTWLFN